MALNDPVLRKDVISDNVYHRQKILTLNMIKMVILTIKIIFWAFYIGQYWFAFVYAIIANSNDMT